MPKDIRVGKVGPCLHGEAVVHILVRAARPLILIGKRRTFLTVRAGSRPVKSLAVPERGERGRPFRGVRDPLLPVRSRFDIAQNVRAAHALRNAPRSFNRLVHQGVDDGEPAPDREAVAYVGVRCVHKLVHRINVILAFLAVRHDFCDRHIRAEGGKRFLPVERVIKKVPGPGSRFTHLDALALRERDFRRRLEGFGHPDRDFAVQGHRVAYIPVRPAGPGKTGVIITRPGHIEKLTVRERGFEVRVPAVARILEILIRPGDILLAHPARLRERRFIPGRLDRDAVTDRRIALARPLELNVVVRTRLRHVKSVVVRVRERGKRVQQLRILVVAREPAVRDISGNLSPADPRRNIPGRLRTVRRRGIHRDRITFVRGIFLVGIRESRELEHRIRPVKRGLSVRKRSINRRAQREKIPEDRGRFGAVAFLILDQGDRGTHVRLARARVPDKRHLHTVARVTPVRERFPDRDLDERKTVGQVLVRLARPLIRGIVTAGPGNVERIIPGIRERGLKPGIPAVPGVLEPGISGGHFLTAHPSRPGERRESKTIIRGHGKTFVRIKTIGPLIDGIIIPRLNPVDRVRGKKRKIRLIPFHRIRDPGNQCERVLQAYPAVDRINGLGRICGISPGLGPDTGRDMIVERDRVIRVRIGLVRPLIHRIVVPGPGFEKRGVLVKGRLERRPGLGLLDGIPDRIDGRQDLRFHHPHVMTKAVFRSVRGINTVRVRDALRHPIVHTDRPVLIGVIRVGPLIDRVLKTGRGPVERAALVINRIDRGKRFLLFACVSNKTGLRHHRRITDTLASRERHFRKRIGITAAFVPAAERNAGIGGQTIAQVPVLKACPAEREVRRTDLLVTEKYPAVRIIKGLFNQGGFRVALGGQSIENGLKLDLPLRARRCHLGFNLVQAGLEARRQKRDLGLRRGTAHLGRHRNGRVLKPGFRLKRVADVRVTAVRPLITPHFIVGSVPRPINLPAFPEKVQCRPEFFNLRGQIFVFSPGNVVVDQGLHPLPGHTNIDRPGHFLGTVNRRIIHRQTRLDGDRVIDIPGLRIRKLIRRIDPVLRGYPVGQGARHREFRNAFRFSRESGRENSEVPRFAAILGIGDPEGGRVIRERVDNRGAYAFAHRDRKLPDRAGIGREMLIHGKTVARVRIRSIGPLISRPLLTRRFREYDARGESVKDLLVAGIRGRHCAGRDRRIQFGADRLPADLRRGIQYRLAVITFGLKAVTDICVLRARPLILAFIIQPGTGEVIERSGRKRR
ncbi:MAG: hypothetical protein BWY49_00530 [Candidatus Omnitrophica bacterium ADurb.Bin314]|nr:MAG: hypothetical protein BWY49_00530 [Candidatus Omnitrophica bacterium ADurb.Bin314]